MASSRNTMFFFLCSMVLYLAVALTIAQEQSLQHFCLNDRGNFSTNSTYQANLKHLLSSLSSNTQIDYGFYNVSYGQGVDRVNTIALCRGDVKPGICRSCLNNSTLELPALCPTQKEAVLWYDSCMLRYSNRSFFHNMEFGPYFWMYSENNVSEPNQFRQVLGNLLDDLKKQAASGGSLRKFAVGNRTTPSSWPIYALVQCTPDLSEQQCSDCLNKATDLIPTCCDGRQGGRVISPSCNFRYEKNIFYDPTVDAATPLSALPPPAISATGGRYHTSILVALILLTAQAALRTQVP